MKSLLVALALVVSVSSVAQAFQNVECRSDMRPMDGDMVTIKFIADANGQVSALLSTAPGGERMPSMPAPKPITDLTIASGLDCIASKLDPRLVFCDDKTHSQFIDSTLVSRSLLEAHGKNDISHVMLDTIEIRINNPAANAQLPNQPIVFISQNCVLK